MNANLISFDDLVKVLWSEAAILDAWAKESRDGGWSTHQVNPMRRRANELRELAERATRDKYTREASK